jgi:hypothetical protein
MQRRMRDGKEEKKEVEEEECQLKDQKLNANDPWMMEASYSKYTITHTHTHMPMAAWLSYRHSHRL